MTMKLHLTIPNPCHEKWDSFKPTTTGGFCSSCEKEVIDFSKLGDEQIKEYFKNKPLNICGRFRHEQLKEYKYSTPQPKKFSNLSLLMMGVALFFYSRPVNAQQVSQPTEQREPEAAKNNVADTVSLKVSGIVRDEGGSGMPGVNISRAGTNQNITTDGEGKFVFEIHDAKSSECLTFSFVGYIDDERIVVPGIQTEQINISLQPAIQMLGEISVVAGGISYRKISPRRWWWKFKNIFQ